MRRLTIQIGLALIFGAAIQNVVAEQRSAFDEAIGLLPARIQWWARSGFSFLPDEWEAGFKEYLDLIGADPSRGMNFSLGQHNSDFLKSNPCTSDMAAEFYLKMGAEDLRFSVATGTPYFTNRNPMPLSKKISDFNKSPGWVWNRAMEYSHGDKLLAMQLIGICGHDDKLQLPYMPSSGIPVSKNQIAHLQQFIPSPIEIEKLARREADKPGGAAVEYYTGVLNSDFKLDKGVLCPEATASFFAPQGLSANADISLELKMRIAKIQAPRAGAAGLPSKNYHIMGAAYTACHLFRRGVPSVLVRQIVLAAANAYRATRVCEKLDYLPPLGTEGETVQSIVQEIVKATQHKSLNEAVADCPFNDSEEVQTIDRALPKICWITEWLLPDAPDGMELNESVLTPFIRASLARLDSIQLFKSSRFYNKAGGCQNTQIGQAVRLFVRLNDTRSSPAEQTPCPKGISAERCLAARKLLETYSVDFEWSEAQHLAGYRFAKQNCPRLDPSNTPEMVACRIQGSK